VAFCPSADGRIDPAIGEIKKTPKSSIDRQERFLYKRCIPIKSGAKHSRS